MAAATSDYLKPISFLVVDDRAYMRRVIKGILETLGCKRIDEAHHGGEAMGIMRSWTPDIVITEWRLEKAETTDGRDQYVGCTASTIPPIVRPVAAHRRSDLAIRNSVTRYSVPTPCVFPWMKALGSMAAVRGRSSDLPGFTDNRFANLRTAATLIRLATGEGGSNPYL